jgi:catechol 2,3-dioxygenase-like lactoylglutathione lyase family enzyme
MTGAGALDRTAQDTGNLVALEHVNVRVPDPLLATTFYVSGLGFTRDPYLMVHTDNMWINLGQEQFHLPTGPPQIVRGTVGLVVPDLDALLLRLASVQKRLSGTEFSFTQEAGAVAVVSPWGNRLRCHAPGLTKLGIAYVAFQVPSGTAAGIARFYERIVGAPAVCEGGEARVRVGGRQSLVFRENAADLPPYDGHHIAVYVADFSGPYGRLAERGLISEENGEFQYRFTDIVDPDGGRVLFTVEHEVRSLTHPMFRRPLVNRNPDQGVLGYVRGQDAFIP